MLRRSLPKFSLFSVLKEELSKAKDLLAHDFTNYSKFLSGEDISEKEKKIREKHQELYQKDAQAAAEIRSKMTWSEKMSAAMEELKNATKKNAAVVAMVQHCTRAHMAEIAVEQDIDIRNIHIVTEGVKNEAGVEVEEKVVGYIEAPNATNEEVLVYAHKLEKACPAAMMHGEIEWRRSPSTPEPIAEKNATTINDKKDDVSFDFPIGSGFSTSGVASGLKKQKYVIDEEGFADSNDEFTQKIETDLPHGSPFHDKQKLDLGSFKPSKRTGNDVTDMNRTAYDLSAALEKAKARSSTTKEVEEEQERSGEKKATADMIKKFREEREKEKLQAMENAKNKAEIPHHEEGGTGQHEKTSKESSSSNEKNKKPTSETDSWTEKGEEKTKAFGSLKDMGLFGKK